MSREWQADEVLSLARGFQPACVLAAAAELDLFGLMGEERWTAEGMAGRLESDLRGTTILLDALTALGLLTKNGDAYTVPESVARLLTAGGAESVLAMTRHQMVCLRRWSELARVVKTGQPAERRPSIRGEEADGEAFIEAMNDINRSAAPALIAELAIRDFKHLLDVGGGSGTWTIAWLDMNPTARATLFDLPHVVPLAEERLGRAGYADRVRLVGGDFDVDPLPTGADLAWVSAIVHQNSRAENRELFGRVHAALVPGGRILLRDIVMEESRTAPPGGAMFAINMLVATSGGGTFPLAEFEADLTAAGFDRVEQIRQDPWMHSVVQAWKPDADDGERHRRV